MSINLKGFHYISQVVFVENQCIAPVMAVNEIFNGTGRGDMVVKTKKSRLKEKNILITLMQNELLQVQYN